MQQIVRSGAQLGAALRRRRKKLGLSQEELTARAKVRQATISNLEGGDAGTKLSTLLNVLAALNLEFVVRPRTKGRLDDIEDIF